MKNNLLIHQSSGSEIGAIRASENKQRILEQISRMGGRAIKEPGYYIGAGTTYLEEYSVEGVNLKEAIQLAFDNTPAASRPNFVRNIRTSDGDEFLKYRNSK